MTQLTLFDDTSAELATRKDMRTALQAHIRYMQAERPHNDLSYYREWLSTLDKRIAELEA